MLDRVEDQRARGLGWDRSGRGRRQPWGRIVWQEIQSYIEYPRESGLICHGATEQPGENAYELGHRHFVTSQARASEFQGHV